MEGFFTQMGGGRTMEDWMRLIQEVGFPIFVSFYLMHRVETKLVAIHEALISIRI